MKYEKTKYPNIYTYQTAKGKRYYIRRSYQQDGKKREVTKSGILTLSDARAFLAEIEQAASKGELKTNYNLTLDEYWEIYSDKKIKIGRWQGNTYQTNESSYRLHISPRFGHIKLKNLSRNDYELHVADMLTRYARTTVDTMHSCFMAILNDAVRCDVLSKNRLSGIYIGKSAITPRNTHMSLDEFRLFIDTAEEILEDYIFALIYVMVFCLRKCEMLGIRTMDVTFREDDRASVYLQDSRSLGSLEGKDGLKTDESERYSVLDIKGTEYIHFLIDRAAKINKKLGRIVPAKKDYLSIRENGQLMHPSSINKYFDKVNEAIGLHVTPHMLRHFFLTQGLIAGVPLEYLRQVAGHTKSTMTQKYIQVKDEISTKVTDTIMAWIG